MWDEVKVVKRAHLYHLNAYISKKTKTKTNTKKPKPHTNNLTSYIKELGKGE